MARGVEKLHPELQPVCEEFVRRCKAAGLNVLVTETLRTKAEQDAIYAQGRTEPGPVISNAPYPKSPHCWGVAFDFCRNVRGREYDDSDGFFRKCGEIGEGLGLTWGGRWKSFVDKPHLELKKYMPDSSTRWLIKTYGMPERFMETWEAVEPEEEEDMFDISKLTDEQLIELAGRMQEALGRQEAQDWGPEWEKAREWAEETGVIKGDQYGNKQYQAFTTRQAMVQMMYRQQKE